MAEDVKLRVYDPFQRITVELTDDQYENYVTINGKTYDFGTYQKMFDDVQFYLDVAQNVEEGPDSQPNLGKISTVLSKARSFPLDTKEVYEALGKDPRRPSTFMDKYLFEYMAPALGVSKEDIDFAKRAGNIFGGAGAVSSDQASLQNAAQNMALGFVAYRGGHPLALSALKAREYAGVLPDAFLGTSDRFMAKNYLEDILGLPSDSAREPTEKEIKELAKLSERGAGEFYDIDFDLANQNFGYEVLGPLYDSASDEEILDAIKQAILAEGIASQQSGEQAINPDYGVTGLGSPLLEQEKKFKGMQIGDPLHGYRPQYYKYDYKKTTAKKQK